MGYLSHYTTAFLLLAAFATPAFAQNYLEQPHGYITSPPQGQFSDPNRTMDHLNAVNNGRYIPGGIGHAPVDGPPPLMPKTKCNSSAFSIGCD